MSSINLFPELNAEQEQERGYNNGHTEHKEDELIVFGYSCKLFRDDFSAKAIERGQSLIPWNGDENVMIDRYDCRGHLFDLTPWDSDLLPKKSSRTGEHCLSDADRRIEEECERERYLDLHKDVEKEALQQEEEYKRVCADKNSYKQVGFTYDDQKKSKEFTIKPTEETAQTFDDDEYEPFYPSEKLHIPYGMDIPESIKLNAVIEKTASFVSTSGLQMEIVLKTKQANNPQFDFLKYDHYLNPYYRHLISMIKSGKYRPNFDNNSNNNAPKKNLTENGVDQTSSHDDDDEPDDSYLHPLLRGGISNETNQTSKNSDEPLRTPSIAMNIHDTAYGQLIKKYENFRQREKTVKDNEEEKMSTTSDEIKNDESSPRSESSLSTNVIPPPPDVKPIIDKLAEYVARNGVAFEKSIRTKNDSRFAFLERDHIHHNYYQLKLQLCAQEIQKKTLEENQRCLATNEQTTVSTPSVKLVLKSNSDESLTPVSSRVFQTNEDSNSMPQHESDDGDEFIGPRPPSPEFLEKLRKQEQRRDRVNEFVRDKLARDKQEERKRKAEMLVQKLKSQTNTSTDPSTNNNSTVNPVLVEKLLNVKSERSSLVTSPKPTGHSKHSRSSSKSRNHSKYYRRSRSRSNNRRTRRTSHKRSRTRSKSRNHQRSKRSKNSKSSRHSRDRHYRHHHRRHHRDSSSKSTSSRSSSTSTSSTSSSKSRKKKNKLIDEQKSQLNPLRNNRQSKKWDQRESINVKQDTTSNETVTSLPMVNETMSSNSVAS